MISTRDYLLRFNISIVLLYSSGSKRQSSCSAESYQDLEVTHRGMHRFIPRHPDEMTIEIGDPIHVIKTGDDLWCEGMTIFTVTLL